jgi:hypothetical protein
MANQSTIFRDIVIQSCDRFQETTRDILWLNYTLHGQSELYTTIRELEFASFQMIQLVSHLLGAIQGDIRHVSY